MPDKIRLDNVSDRYEPSDSDADYDEDEKQLLKSIRDRKKKSAFGEDLEEEVLGFDEDDDEDYDDEDDYDDIRKFDHDSDIEGAEDDGDDLPDRKAWGQKARGFYGTGYVDRDYDSLTAQEEELARLEEIEAKETQQRLAKELNEADFSLDVFIADRDQDQETDQPEEKQSKKTKKNKKKDKTEIHLKADLSDLSERQRRDLFRKEAPEFDGLVEDFERNLQECNDSLEPVLNYLTERNVTEHPMVKLLRVRYDLGVSYCNNIAFYLLLKAKKMKVKNHPVVKRMVQMKQLLQEVEQKYEDSVKMQVETILEHIRSGKEIVFENTEVAQDKPKESKKFAFIEEMDRIGEVEELQSGDSEEEMEEDESGEEPSPKKVRIQSDSDEEEPAQEEDEPEEEAEEGRKKRKITYQIAKNKGLTAHKRKEQRNIRVKNRRKFQKAMVRRKGAVRPVRTEETRYAGESSGIKAFVRRSVKIK